MSFFDIGSMSPPKVSLEVVRDWANEIAAGYLTAGTLPTTTLVKIAQAQDLRPHDVELVATEANKVIHHHKFASATDKYLAADFPLADAKVALERMQATGEIKVAGVRQFSGSLPDPVGQSEDWTGYDVWGSKPEFIDKTASLKREMGGVMEKTAALKHKLEEKAFLEKLAAGSAETAFIKLARHEVLSNAADSKERLHVLGFLSHFVKSAGMSDVGHPALAKVAHVLAAEGLLDRSQAKLALAYFLDKTASSPAPEELISPTLKAQVVNGSHPLYVTLKTFKDHVARMQHARGNRSVVDDHLQIFGERIKAL